MFEEYEYLRLPLVIAKTIQHPGNLYKLSKNRGIYEKRRRS